MRVGNWNLPDRDVRGDRGQELAQRQRHDELEVVPPRDVHVLADSPEIEERPTVDGDAGQLDHGDRHRVRELAQNHLTDDVFAAGHHLPHNAQECDRHHLPGSGLVCGHVVLADHTTMALDEGERLHFSALASVTVVVVVAVEGI